MSLAKNEKEKIILEHGNNSADTGSVEVQVALFTERITQLTEHLRQHPKDFACRRGLLRLVGKRRNLLNYVRRQDIERYRALIERLGLRK
ncbi:MAG TPA: 30S ribosomal protein S15 [Candidatus Hydrogenedentes bacterium]|nr:30S ribosomal protein S15 [Candidatus Hydrogenedentota bacterium]